MRFAKLVFSKNKINRTEKLPRRFAKKAIEDKVLMLFRNAKTHYGEALSACVCANMLVWMIRLRQK